MSKVELDVEFIKVMMMTAAIDYKDNEDRSKRINNIIDEVYDREMKGLEEWNENTQKQKDEATTPIKEGE